LRALSNRAKLESFTVRTPDDVSNHDGDHDTGTPFYDLVAAGKIGFATAFVIRAGEDPPPASQEFDLVAANFDDLAIQINQKFLL
jgi:hypothetical protein